MNISVPTLQLLVWIARRPRSYAETAEAWTAYASRVATYDAALAHGLVEIDSDRVVLTAAGAALLTSSIWRVACYADQNERDYRALEDAVTSGRVAAQHVA
jgi:hypothetical protein